MLVGHWDTSVGHGVPLIRDTNKTSQRQNELKFWIAGIIRGPLCTFHLHASLFGFKIGGFVPSRQSIKEMLLNRETMENILNIPFYEIFQRKQWTKEERREQRLTQGSGANCRPEQRIGASATARVPAVHHHHVTAAYFSATCLFSNCHCELHLASFFRFQCWVLHDLDFATHWSANTSV